MSMSKKDFIALADILKRVTRSDDGSSVEWKGLLDDLASFCKQTNSNFMRDRWLAYIAGECGPNGGGVKEPKSWAVQGNYGQGWETVCTEDDRKEARQRLHEYDENEPEYDHRLVRA